VDRPRVNHRLTPTERKKMKSRKALIIASTVAFLTAAILCISCSGSRGKGTPWKNFSSGKVGYVVPDGWTRADPFTTGTPYWSHLWFHDSPTHKTRVAFLQSPVGKQNQIFLILGERDEMAAKIQEHIGKYNDHPLVDSIDEAILKTFDGVTVKLYTARMAPGALAGDDVTYVLGFADLGDEVFVINGGGKTSGFDFDIVSDLIQSMNLGTK